MRIFIKSILLLTFVFVFVGSGCLDSAKPKLVPVSGTVTQNNKPLSDVRLEFRKPDTGTSAFAETDSNGRFTLTHSQGESGAEPGKYLVSIFQKGKPITPTPEKNTENLPEELRNQMTPELEIRNSDGSQIEIVIPEKGNNDLNVEVK
ncbi:MAG: carboxypeptidase-like regulatory domain-containing protein [Planctomycetaceae bacterium]|jgi:hypothetical protein|nr:carboxypeptidase-like regulatory domain-containing protein [Planctomycetaceae bacterium]